MAGGADRAWDAPARLRAAVRHPAAPGVHPAARGPGPRPGPALAADGEAAAARPGQAHLGVVQAHRPDIAGDAGIADLGRVEPEGPGGPGHREGAGPAEAARRGAGGPV